MTDVKKAFEIAVKNNMNHFANEDNEEIEKANKIICDYFPFLKSRREYTSTWLDDFEPGWLKAFGWEMCCDLKEECEKHDVKIHILQIKEKFGELCFYYSYETESSVSRIAEIVNKYEMKSRNICGKCGEKAEYITEGWIYPLCGRCKKELGIPARLIKEHNKKQGR